MEVNFYATLRAIIGIKTIEVPLGEKMTAIELVDQITKKYPALRDELLDAENRFHRHMKLFINGREAVYLPDEFDTIIKPNDKIDIFPPVGGG